MDNDGKRINPFAVDEDIHTHNRPGRVAQKSISKRGKPAADRLEAVKEVHHHISHGQGIGQLDLAAKKTHVLLLTALFFTQADHATNVVLRHKNVGENDGLAYFIDLSGIGQARRVVQVNDVATGHLQLIQDRKSTR